MPCSYAINESSFVYRHFTLIMYLAKYNLRIRLIEYFQCDHVAFLLNHQILHVSGNVEKYSQYFLCICFKYLHISHICIVWILCVCLNLVVNLILKGSKLTCPFCVFFFIFKTDFYKITNNILMKRHFVTFGHN